MSFLWLWVFYLNVTIGQDAGYGQPFTLQANAWCGAPSVEVSNFFHFQDAFPVNALIGHVPLLLATLAPRSIRCFVRVPHLTILLTATHFDIMGGAPAIVIRASVIVVRLIALALVSITI
jgi:hypothetical protein